MDPAIGEATSGDLPHILAVYRQAGLAPCGSLTMEEATAVQAKMKTYPFYKVFVAELERQIVGTFELLIMDNLANGGQPSGIVEDVAVLPTFQGHGIGKAMVRHAMNLCAEHRCYKMALSSNEARSDAHRFYESLGFTRHGYSYLVELQ